MCQLDNANVKEMDLLANAQKTTAYLFDAICELDFESAQLELSELNLVIKRLADMKKKRERKNLLVGIVAEMRDRGINIDFARRAFFFGHCCKKCCGK